VPPRVTRDIPAMSRVDSSFQTASIVLLGTQEREMFLRERNVMTVKDIRLCHDS
jgi:hypothetical protein